VTRRSSHVLAEDRAALRVRAVSTVRSLSLTHGGPTSLFVLTRPHTGWPTTFFPGDPGSKRDGRRRRGHADATAQRRDPSEVAMAPGRVTLLRMFSQLRPRAGEIEKLAECALCGRYSRVGTQKK
jgi:hypothetical protein